ncbi:hypothetical protein Acsp03_27790 [Actinomadura sp. NBRC 104412]|uniref:putative bifunctional diguanylate cyclase/phosphodiesterase n=1 Tax=Actinomadura sp. NBRC 104412 TaxID=3032203 RepID=UPI0024A3F632|nr:EAL domain-containing protein [Actinomadura sp. NBRC 104412]GLZ05313.1 hypothetical protein Acsp03_27790 [Actinomadura sp. NBRC 104412]
MSGDRTWWSPRRVPPRALPVGMVAVAGVLYVVGSLLGWGGAAFVSWGEAAASAVAAVVLIRAYRVAPQDGSGWRWFGVAAASWFVAAVGSALWSGAATRSALSLSISDLFYLIAVGSLAAGLVAPARLPRDGYAWVRYAADVYLFVAALFVLGWVTQFGDLYHRSGETPSEFLLELLYPLIDVVVLCAALPFAVGASRAYRVRAWAGYGALAAFAAADVVTMIARLRGGGVEGDPADVLRVAGLVLLVLMPLVVPVPAVEADQDGTWRLGRVGVVPAVVAAVAALVVTLHALVSGGVDPVVPLVAGTAALVVLARLAGLLRENERLRRAVDSGEDHFRALSESINDAVLICDLKAVVQYASAGALRMYRYAPQELLDRPLHEIIHPEDLPRVRAVFAELLAGEEEWEAEEAVDDPDVDDLPEGVVPDGSGSAVAAEGAEAAGNGAFRLAFRIRASDGTWLPTESTVSRYSGTGEARGRLLITTRDLSEEAALRRQVTHLTFHDGLTGLPNRAFFEERTRELLSRQPREGEDGCRVAVLFVDLDGFTAVNDSAGHAAGDQVLAQAARRLRGTVQADDTVCRWGGDEYAVLVQLPADASRGTAGGGPSRAETRAAVDLAERMLRVLTLEPYRVGGRGIALTASIGIAFAGDEEGAADAPKGKATAAPQPRDAGRRLRRSAADLIRNGDLAMARAKELGGGRVEVFAPHMHADVVRRLELGTDLRKALAEEQFALEFQPVVELATSRVTGVEALLRWWRGNESVPPEEFIGPAEESGLMVPLGEWALREACREVARWRGGSWDIGLSVNFTARQIQAPRFVESVAAALEDTGLSPEALTVEVREEVLVEDAGQSVARLSELRRLGVRLAIDDFGTGYASLAYLGQLPVDVLKIDPSFVAALGTDETGTLLTRAIVGLGAELGLTVVAEGIERPEQLELLRAMRCPAGQGFLVARPMAARRVESLVRTNLEAQALPGEIPLPLDDEPPLSHPVG